jgi:predicted ATPase
MFLRDPSAKRPAYISKIHLRHIRGFRDLEIDLMQADGVPRRRTLIIGKNGTQKTTLLRSLAIGLADQAGAITLLSLPNGSYASRASGRINLQLTDPDDPHKPPVSYPTSVYRTRVRVGDDGAVTESARKGDKGLPLHQAIDRRSRASGDLEPFVCGYGAGRYGFGTASTRGYKIVDSVYTLFDYGRSLINPELTLRRLRDDLGEERYESTLSGIRTVLGLAPEDEIRLRRGGGVEISIDVLGEPIPLEAWADGYRLTFSWLLDLYGWAMQAGVIDKSGNVHGIVLIDEIDQHLHPSMQAKILPFLAKALPEVQLFATTHSPLVALGAAPEELVVLRREGADVVAETQVPDFSGYSAEDMLSDAHLFDSSVYSPETNAKLARYKELATIPPGGRDPQQRDELRSLALDLRAQQIPEARESETMEQLRLLIAKHNL